MNKRKRYGTVPGYLLVSALCVAVDNIYALFGHGVRSASMSFMFLYPLLGGALFYFLLGMIAPNIAAAKRYRLGYNLFNSGIATLTVGSFFGGILDIAGTASAYTKAFMIVGWAYTAVGLIALLAAAIRTRRSEL